jgi:hypothetical protein
MKPKAPKTLIETALALQAGTLDPKLVSPRMLKNAKALGTVVMGGEAAPHSPSRTNPLKDARGVHVRRTVL